MTGRNERCPCGSGARYKACCGRTGAAAPAPGQAATTLPGDAIAQFNFGNALARAGQFEAAAERYRQALAIHTDFAEARQRLGEVYGELGQFEAAAAECRRALASRPDYAEAYDTLGCALLNGGHVEDAIVCFGRALQLSPGFVAAHIHRAGAQRSIGRLDDAASGYRRALALEPAHVAAHTELATTLRLQRRTREAGASCASALELDPASAAALTVQAELRADAGQFDAARQLLERAVSLAPGAARAWAGLAQLRTMTAADESWQRAVERLLDKRLLPREELHLRYALGKYFDDLKRYDEAFTQYARANDLDRRYAPAHDRTALARFVDRIVSSLDAKWLRFGGVAACASARPVLVVGMLRSGTTLAEQMLASHPRAAGAGELPFWGSAWNRLQRAATAAGNELVQPDPTAVARLADAYLAVLDETSTDAARIIDKMPTNFLLLGLIHAALPNARIIHMRRNPYDTCVSIYFQHFQAINTYATDLGDLAHYTLEYRRLMNHWRSVLPEGTMLEVPYERLVEDPELWCRRMVEFVGLPWSSRCLDFHLTERSVVTASKWQVRQKIYAASVGRWRHYEKFLGPLAPLAGFD